MDDAISRKAAISAVFESAVGKRMLAGHKDLITILKSLPSAQPEITDEQAIEHLQDTGWMQNHDHEMYMMGIRDGLADDSDSYDSLIQPEQKVGKWIMTVDRSGFTDWVCPSCGGSGRGDYRFCPWCNAKMEGTE